MREIDILQRHVGVNFNQQQMAEACLWSPFAKEVILVNQTTKKEIHLYKGKGGYWNTISTELAPDDLYVFSIVQEDGTVLERADPASLSQPDGVHGSSAAVDLHSFTWTDQDWKGLDAQQYIFYELHTGTFTTEGTFDALESKLDHLLELGITAIELMPLAQFPGARNWGYDGVFPYAVQSSYGGAAALQQLINACHRKGLAVVLDVVYNHVGPEGNYLSDFGPYFTDKYHTPWGAAINVDDAWSEGPRRFLIENVLMWFRDFHIDALRLDAVHAIKDFGAVHILQEISKNVAQLNKEIGSKHLLFAESDLNDPKYILPVESRGYGMDGQWVDEFHHALRVCAGQKREGYYSDFHGITDLEKSYRAAYVYDGVYSEHRKKVFGAPVGQLDGEHFIVFSQNHDQVGNRMLGERSSTLLSFEMQKLLAGAVLLSPFLPLLFMGEEWGETNPFQYFVSHTDAALVELVRKGRKEEFASFQSEAEVPDPQDEQTFIRSRLDWKQKDAGQQALMFSFYKELIAIRKSNAAWQDLDRKSLTTVAYEDQDSLLIKWKNVLVLLNFSKTAQELDLDISTNYKNLIDSAAEQWGGNHLCKANISGTLMVPVAAESFQLYAATYDV